MSGIWLTMATSNGLAPDPRTLTPDEVARVQQDVRDGYAKVAADGRIKVSFDIDTLSPIVYDPASGVYGVMAFAPGEMPIEWRPK